jgi:hypothetical protein
MKYQNAKFKYYHSNRLNIILLFFITLNKLALTQSIQSFGSSAGVISSGTSTTFIPNPTNSGSTYVRIGNQSGDIKLYNYSPNELGTSGSFGRVQAPTGFSVNKLTPILNMVGSPTFYSRFKIKLGLNLNNNVSNLGTWYMFIGNGADDGSVAGDYFSNANGFAGFECFTGFQFRYRNFSSAGLYFRNGSSWSQVGLTDTLIYQGIMLDFEIFGNNQSSGNISYTYNNVNQTLAPNKVDVYLHGKLIGDDISKAQLNNNINIRSIMFFGENSGSQAILDVDDVTLQNSVPTSIQRLSYPSAFSLANGNYSLTSWSNNNTIGTYPSNMIFHYGGVNATDPLINQIVASQDFEREYQLTKGSIISGLDTNGFAFWTESNNASLTSGNIGEAVLAINTLSVTNIQLSWIAAREINSGNRYLLRAQYRIGNSGNYQDLPGTISQIEFNSANSGPFNFGPITLPSTCDNQPLVQIRWIYYWSGSGSGARDGIRLDDIVATSTYVYSSLPIELINFEANINEQKLIDLNWSTATEKNNNYFTIEKSDNGIIFNEIFKIEGSGDSYIKKDYHLIDSFPLEGVSYYKLKQTDYNGDYKYSKIVAINYNAIIDFKIFPNPVNSGEIKITDNKNNQIDCIVEFFDNTFRKIKIDYINYNKNTINVSGMEKGMYHVIIHNQEKYLFKKLIIN